jgi:hypothetical protein
MGYILGGSTIKRPHSMDVGNNTQTAQNRTLSGSITRDQFGSNKRVWSLEYSNILPADFDTINNIYQTYLTNGTAQTWQITETNYTIHQLMCMSIW